jgi:hypothetical protein
VSANRWAIDAVWDIECADWDQFLMGALWTRAEGVQVYKDPDELADAIMALPAGAQTWAHSGGKYDVLWLLDQLCKRGSIPDAMVSMSGSSASSVKFKGGPWLRDSARLVPMSLATAAPIAGKGRTKGDPGLPCICDRDCGGYCSLSHDMKREHWRSVEEYQVSDVELLRDVLVAVQGYAEQNAIELRGTVGGTAWATAQAWCGVEDADWSGKQYNLTAPAYMGGRVEVGMPKAERIWRYDRKSAYPAALTLPVPTGEATTLTEATAGRAYRRDRPGAYYARVQVPESHTPPLPVRHHNRLAYPWGMIDGVWSHVELRHAEQVGCKIDKITGGVSWEGEAPIYKGYSDECFRLRDEVEDWQKASLGQWDKFLANSLTGKLGQSPDWMIVKLGDCADDRGYEMVGGSPWVWAREVWRIPSCANVHHAMTLTSRARVELDEQTDHAGDAWVYSDTDSCFATRPLTRNVGKRLGDWDFEGESAPPIELGETWGDEPSDDDRYGWLCEAPKVYAYYDRKHKKTGKPERVAHAKGVPDGDKPDVWYRYTRGGEDGKGESIHADQGVDGLLTAARSGKLFKRRKLARTLHRNPDWCGGRMRGPGDSTRAPHVTDLPRLT